MNKIKVLVADDHAIVRIGLKSVLDYETDIEVVGEAKNGIEAVQEAERTQPDVIIMDLVMPRKDGVSATREIHARFPDPKILILTTFGSASDISQALTVGATGAVTKNLSNTDLMKAIRDTRDGVRHVSPEIEQSLTEDNGSIYLTPRQHEVLGSITRGLSNDNSATMLGISKSRVKQHLNELYEKLGASNRAEAVSIALRKHLLKL